jgi:FecR protein
MRFKTKLFCAAVLAAASLLARQAFADADASWRVAKSSGEVWISSSETPQPVSLTSDADVRPGQTVRTGENGMLLLVRGEESMLVSPNAVIDIPKENRDGMSTTIIERAGSVLVKAEKRKVNHFEVVTPYLAAVVKGTQFRVSADRGGSNVEVLEGQVDVSGFKSGEQILLLPGQTAKVAASGSGALNTSGSGLFNPVRVGPPRTSPVRLDEPKAKFADAGTSASAPMPANDNSKPAAAGTVSTAAAAPTSAGARQGIAFNSAGAQQPYEATKTVSDKIDLVTVGVPMTVGAIVMLAVMVGRGRKNRKEPSKRDRWQA